MSNLLKSDFSEADLMIDHLFDKICDRLKPEERNILTIASYGFEAVFDPKISKSR